MESPDAFGERRGLVERIAATDRAGDDELSHVDPLFGVAASWSIAPYADSPAKAVDVPATLPLGVAALDPLMRRIVPAPCSSMPGSTCRTAAENPEY